MNKEEIRLKYFKKRKSLSSIEFQDGCHKISHAFLAYIENLNAQTIHIYLPIASKVEIDTWLIIKELWKRQIRVAVPLLKVEDSSLTHHLLHPETNLITNEWGVEEPDSSPELPISEIDMVVVPLLAYDENGYRVGYGKGFYDRFLAECNEEITKIGLSLFPPEKEIEGFDAYDVPLNLCFTPHAALHF